MLDVEKVSDAFLNLVIKNFAQPLLERIVALEGRKPEKGEKGEPGRDGRDGKDGDSGRDGASGADGVHGAAGPAGEKGVPGDPGRDGLPGRDGRDGPQGLAGADGVNGKDGRDGIDGKDGAPGLNGKDGLGFDDLTCSVEDGGRVLVLKFVCGERIKEFRLITATMIYRGVYRDTETYEHGDTVTWGGSLWHCNEETKAKPGDREKAWTLAAKRGNDGNNGLPGKDGERGPQGFPGRDRTI